MSEVVNDTIEFPHDYCVWLGNYDKQAWHPWFENASSADEVFAKTESPQLIVLSVQAELQDELLSSLRSHELTSHSLILVTHESSLTPYLANGLWRKNYHEQYQDYLVKKSQVRLDHQGEAEAKLLSYLWLHSDFCLEPHSEPTKSHLYNYPLLNAWGITAEESFSWLNSVKNSDWITTDRLVNRVRFCPSCHSGHLNYIDVCPQCQSIDTSHQSSLHCFNCGHIGKQDSFRKMSTLQCPNCLQNLRHIGVDYDRPIENQHCNSCDTLFVDAIVEAECLHCHVHSALDELHVRNIYSYKLTQTGRNRVRRGRGQTLFNLVPGEQMSGQQFYWLIDWQNKLAKRHKQTHTILSIQMENVAEFLAAEGESNGFAQLDAIQERLRSVVRVTDACSNYTQDGLLMLLPLTELAHLQPIYKKLFDLKEMQNTSKIELTVKAITLPAEIGENVADWLTDQLIKTRPM